MRLHPGSWRSNRCVPHKSHRGIAESAHCHTAASLYTGTCLEVHGFYSTALILKLLEKDFTCQMCDHNQKYCHR